MNTQSTHVQSSRPVGSGYAFVASGAIARGCKYAYADTMEYQAPRFYLAHGFGIVGQIPDWDSRGHSKLYLSKRLNDSTISL